MSTILKNNWLHRGAFFTSLLLACLLSSLAFGDDWSLKDKDGVRHTLAEQKGKWVLVNFWAPWCPSCLAELPELNALQLQHKDLVVIGVAVQYQTKQEVIGVAKNKSISYPVVFGSEDDAADFGGLVGLPTSFLYSPSGKLVGHHDGPLTQNEVEQAIKQQPDSVALFTR